MAIVAYYWRNEDLHHIYSSTLYPILPAAGAGTTYPEVDKFLFVIERGETGYTYHGANRARDVNNRRSPAWGYYRAGGLSAQLKWYCGPASAPVHPAPVSSAQQLPCEKKKALYIPNSPHQGTLDDYCSPRRSRSSLWHQPYALTSQFSSRPI